jgi:hypothetical protein
LLPRPAATNLSRPAATKSRPNRPSRWAGA